MSHQHHAEAAAEAKPKILTPEQQEELKKDIEQIREMTLMCDELRAKHGMPPEFVFPDIGENIGGHHFDGEKKLLWVAVKITQFDFLGACAFLRSYELQLWMIYRDLHAKKSMLQKLAAGVGLGGVLKK